MQTLDAAEGAPQAPARRRDLRPLAFWGAAIVAIALDQLTKWIVRSSLDRGESWPDGWDIRIKHVTNSGAAFGILQGQTLFLIVMACIGLAAIYLYYRNPPFHHWTASLGIGLMLGGALGNLIDRILRERVTDFIDFPRWPAFNLADSSIFIGVSIIVIGYSLFGDHATHRKPPPPDDPPYEDAPADG